MNREQYEKLKRPSIPVVRAADLKGGDRTLLYGYDIDRLTWHVYLMGGLIHRVVYNHRDEIEAHTKAEQWTAEELIPNKRVYPESADHDFALLLAPLVDVPYMGVFDGDRYERVKNRQFHGLTKA